MSEANRTFLVAALFECDSIFSEVSVRHSEPVWKQTLIGCQILMLLQDMYGFQIKYYLRGPETNLSEFEKHRYLYPHMNNSVDIYARPLAFTPEAISLAYPTQYVFSLRFGFMVRRLDLGRFGSFYTMPFTSRVWYSVLLLVIFTSTMFFVSRQWERRILRHRGECSFVKELLLVVAACCQQAPSVSQRLLSRKTAFLSFSVFAQMTYSLYTSNLLSQLVSEGEPLQLEELGDSSYECVVLDTVRFAIEAGAASHSENLFQRYNVPKTVDLLSGLHGVQNCTMALLSDYISLYPLIEKSWSDEEICQYMEIDIDSDIKNYFFTSKNFPLKEQFKSGILRAMESGILRRIVQSGLPADPVCISKPSVKIQLMHVSVPLSILASTALIALSILFAENIHFKRTQMTNTPAIKQFAL